jgi:hypothetical protein
VAVLTELYLGNVCSWQEILRRGAPSQDAQRATPHLLGVHVLAAARARAVASPARLDACGRPGLARGEALQLELEAPPHLLADWPQTAGPPRYIRFLLDKNRRYPGKSQSNMARQTARNGRRTAALGPIACFRQPRRRLEAIQRAPRRRLPRCPPLLLSQHAPRQGPQPLLLPRAFLLRHFVTRTRRAYRPIPVKTAAYNVETPAHLGGGGARRLLPLQQQARRLRLRGRVHTVRPQLDLLRGAPCGGLQH